MNILIPQSEFRQHFYIFKQFIFHNKIFIESIENIQLRLVLIYYYNLQLFFLIGNYIYKDYSLSQLNVFVKSSNNLVIYYPVIDRYFSNDIFYLSFHVFIQFVILPIILLFSSFVHSHIKAISIHNLLKIYLITATFIPFFTFVPAFLIAYPVLAMIFSVIINKKINNVLNIDTKLIEYAVISLLHLPIVAVYFIL